MIPYYRKLLIYQLISLNMIKIEDEIDFIKQMQNEIDLDQFSIDFLKISQKIQSFERFKFLKNSVS